LILSKQNLLDALANEIRIILHLASKAGAEQLSYRPSASQRSTLDLLRYFTMVGPLHLRGALASHFDMADWGRQFQEHETAAAALGAEQAMAAIAGLPAIFEEILAPCTDEFLREPAQLFGTTNSRAVWILNIVLSHYTAYRMQLFLYLKASGHPELNTMNLWVGIDGSMTPPPA
jgi:hypothetical protein